MLINMALHVSICMCLILILNFDFVFPASVRDEAALDCPANEKYYKCSLEVCYKTCNNLKSPPACPSISSDCFLPSCECVEDYLRNSEGVCVPIRNCD